MKLNWKTAAAGLLLLTLIVLVIPQTARQSDHDQSKLRSSSEMQIKQQMLEQDVIMTEGLCRKQCQLKMQQVIQQFATDDQAIEPTRLEAMQQDHPHMRYLESHHDGRTSTQGTITDLPPEVKPYIELARDTVKRQRAYESPRISTKDGPYFVTAVIASHGEGYVLGAIRQQVLEHVRVEQRKNLRLVPYPSDARYGIQAADSDTLRKVDVDHPEENEDISHYYKHDVVVRFIEEPDAEALALIGEELDADEIQKTGYAYVFHSRSLTVEQMMDYFQQGHEVHYVEPHYLYVTNEAPNEPNDALYADYQWNLPAIRTETAWGLAEEGEEVIVAVVDTGVDLNHPDLKDRLVLGYNVFTEGSDAYDDVGHGTHVAGIIAAQINNYEGIAGVAPRTRIMPVKVLDETGAGSTYAVAQGIIWATDNGARVINLSLGNYAEAEFLHDAIRYAYDRDVVLVAATGNDHTESPGYPAAYDEVFAVGATDYDQSVAQFSNYGEYVDVAAPGVSIASTYPSNQYAALSGTSMASPHTAALAAMIRSVNPKLTNEQIMQLIRTTAADLGDRGHDRYYGYGQIDVGRAVEAARTSDQSIIKWSENVSRDIDRIKSRYD